MLNKKQTGLLIIKIMKICEMPRTGNLAKAACSGLIIQIRKIIV